MGFLAFKSALSFGVLCGTAMWAFTQCYTDTGTEDYWTCSNIAFLLMTLYGLIGFWKYGKSSFSGRSPKFFRFISTIANIYTVPLLCVDMYMFNNFTYEVAYSHLAYPLMALVAFVKDQRPHQKLGDIVNFMSLTSMSFISAMSKNYYGLTAAIMYAIANYVLSRVGKHLGIASKDTRNYFLTCFVFFALRALVLAEVKWLNGGGLIFSFRKK